MSVIKNDLTSNEIAAITGKLHDNVVRDIEIIIDEIKANPDLGFLYESTTYKAEGGDDSKCYKLDEDAAMLLASGYPIIMRAKIIKRLSKLKPKTEHELFLEWYKTRCLGKAHRVDSTTAMRVLAGKMIDEGSKLNPSVLRTMLIDNTNKILFDQKGESTNWSECMDEKQLNSVRIAGDIIADIISNISVDCSSNDIIIAINKQLRIFTSGVGRSVLMDDEYAAKLQLKELRKLRSDNNDKQEEARVGASKEGLTYF